MRRTGLAIAIVVLAAGCAARPDPNAPVALATQRVDGAFVLTFWTDDGATARAADTSYSGATVSAVSMVKGAERVAPGTMHADGTFTVPEAPADDFLLVFDARAQNYEVVAWETSAATFLLDRNFAGRYDVAYARSFTPVHLDFTNLEPWSDGILEVESSNAGFVLAVAAGNSLAAGAVDTSTLPLYDWYSQNPGHPLPEAALGDQVYVHQLQARTVAAGSPGAGLAYSASARAALLSDVTLTSGQVGTIQTGPSGLSEATPVDLSLTVPVSQWEALLPDMGPGASHLNPSTFVTVSATPFQTTLPAPAIMTGEPGLLILPLSYGSANLSGVPVRYGRFLDGLWHEVVATSFGAYVQYQNVTTTQTAKIFSAVPLGSGSASLAPVVSPPLQPLVNGKSLFQAEAGVTTTPTLSWSPPRVGSATSYQVDLFRLGPTGIVQPILRAYVRSRSLRVPSGILLPSNTYFARLTAHSAPWDVDGYLGTYDFPPAYPYAYASCLTSTFTP